MGGMPARYQGAFACPDGFCYGNGRFIGEGETTMSNGSREGASLAGKVAAVTGATSGSGRAIARRFVEEGANVYLLARGAERLKEMEELLGPSAAGIPTDVGDPDSVRAAFAEIENQHHKLDILINNAAIYRPVPFEDLPDEEIDVHFRTNLLGPIYTCRAAIPLMRAAGGGDIINTSSEATIESFAMLSMYAVTKAGTRGPGTGPPDRVRKGRDTRDDPDPGGRGR